MASILNRERIASLCTFIDRHVQQQGCDHSHRFARQWAQSESMDWDDLLDILEANGGHCDCEVVLNLPDDEDVDVQATRTRAVGSNPWLLPPAFTYDESHKFNKVIVSRENIGKNTHTIEGELLVPAPHNTKPRGRIRKSVHFFVGCNSGKASEVGIVQTYNPISAADFVRLVIAGGINDLSKFGIREAAFVLSKIAILPEGTTLGTNFSERVNIASKHEELTIHRIILRR